MTMQCAEGRSSSGVACSPIGCSRRIRAGAGTAAEAYVMMAEEMTVGKRQTGSVPGGSLDVAIEHSVEWTCYQEYESAVLELHIRHNSSAHS